MPGAPTIVPFAALVYICFSVQKTTPRKPKNVRRQDRPPRRPRGRRPRRRRRHHRLRPGLLPRPDPVVDPRGQHDHRAPGGAQPAGGPPRAVAGHGHQRGRPDPGAGRVLHRPGRQLRRRHVRPVVHLGEHAAGHAAGRQDGPRRRGRLGHDAL